MEVQRSPLVCSPRYPTGRSAAIRKLPIFQDLTRARDDSFGQPGEPRYFVLHRGIQIRSCHLRIDSSLRAYLITSLVDSR